MPVMSAFLLWVCTLKYSGSMKWDVINKRPKKGLEIAIFELLFLSDMPTTLYVSFYHTSSIAMHYLVHRRQSLNLQIWI